MISIVSGLFLFRRIDGKVGILGHVIVYLINFLQKTSCIIVCICFNPKNRADQIFAKFFLCAKNNHLSFCELQAFPSTEQVKIVTSLKNSSLFAELCTPESAIGESVPFSCNHGFSHFARGKEMRPKWICFLDVPSVAPQIGTCNMPFSMKPPLTIFTIFSTGAVFDKQSGMSLHTLCKLILHTTVSGCLAQAALPVSNHGYFSYL